MREPNQQATWVGSEESGCSFCTAGHRCCAPPAGCLLARVESSVQAACVVHQDSQSAMARWEKQIRLQKLCGGKWVLWWPAEPPGRRLGRPDESVLIHAPPQVSQSGRVHPCEAARLARKERKRTLAALLSGAVGIRTLAPWASASTWHAICRPFLCSQRPRSASTRGRRRRVASCRVSSSSLHHRRRSHSRSHPDERGRRGRCRCPRRLPTCRRRWCVQSLPRGVASLSKGEAPLSCGCAEQIRPGWSSATGSAQGSGSEFAPLSSSMPPKDPSSLSWRLSSLRESVE